MIPVTIILCVKNEMENLPHSLPPLKKYFDDVLIVDSHSTDGTENHATHQFAWNGQYPKKRQWILDNLKTKYDWVLMIDADEIVTDDFINDLQSLDFTADGYFIKSDMVWRDKYLKFGMKNNKLCLFKKSKFTYPVIDDLDIEGMGEMEGHYQPIPQNTATIKQIKSPLIHHDHKHHWHDNHKRYIAWEVGMSNKNAWPADPITWRNFIKHRIRKSRLRPYIIFIYGYILKYGFLDGKFGFNYALNRARYTHRIINHGDGGDGLNARCHGVNVFPVDNETQNKR